MNEAILDKIRKLQALAENAGTEAEAASAAAMVQRLCQQHNLEIGAAQLAVEEVSATEARHDHDSGRYQAHWSSCAAACADMFGVGVYRDTSKKVTTQGGRVVGTERNIFMVFYGLRASVQSAQVTYQYLLSSVESMLAGWIRTGQTQGGLSERRSFRMGCARRILDEAKKLKAAQVAQLPTAEVTALVRLENQLVKAHAASLRLRSSGGYHRASDGGAYSAGYAAGGRVDLHGANGRMLA